VKTRGTHQRRKITEPSAGRHRREARPASLLAVDVGNTQTVVGIFQGSEVRDLFRLSTGLPRTGDDLWPLIERLAAPYREDLVASGRCVIGSVVPAQTPAWEGLAQRLLGSPAFVASAANARGIMIEIKDPASVGVDRIANAVAVAELYRLPAIVVDLGTATTFDVVLPGPRYVGGVIAPGMVTSADELFRRAARLPKVEIRRPVRVLGQSTEESVQSGVYFGAMGQIDGLLRRLSAELALRPFVIATGGLAEAVAGDSEWIERVDAALTLQGLRILEERAAHAGSGTASRVRGARRGSAGRKRRQAN
jgi:type III pantothenate kinase